MRHAHGLRRDQESRKDERFVIFMADVAGCAMVTPQAVPESLERTALQSDTTILMCPKFVTNVRIN